MGKHIVYQWHRDGAVGMINNIGAVSPVEIIEKGQREMKKQGFTDGVTWITVEGTIVDAMIKSRSLYTANK